MKNIFKLQKFILILFLILSIGLNAQGDAGFGDGNVDDETLPINGLLIAGLLAGAALGLRKTKK
jgi:hypothetical protein